MLESPTLAHCRDASPTRGAGLLNTRFHSLARNTIDYWMVPDERELTAAHLESAMDALKPTPHSTFSLYLHVPFCAQHCNFCAFSGGNSLELAEAERYSELLVEQLYTMVRRLNLQDRQVRAVNIGGGSPNLLRGAIGKVLRALRDLSGVNNKTEIAVECELGTTTQEFVDELAKYEVTKLSFGIQTLNDKLRGHLQVPKSIKSLPRVLEWAKNRIPIINADLITCLPGQKISDVDSDLRALIEHPQINGISTYLLTLGAAPALVARILAGKVPKQASFEEQAYMRLHSYSTLGRNGWVRRGTNSYYDSRIPSQYLEKVAGHECIGTNQYDDILLSVGPQAVSSLPGMRLENIVVLNDWTKAVEDGTLPFFLKKCSLVEQSDMDLWLFPLRWEGLSHANYERMLERNALTETQQATLQQYVDEGLVVRGASRYELSIIGEVFMGHLVRGLKKPAGQQVLDEYIEEGLDLGQATATVAITDLRKLNRLNNRQEVSNKRA